jgi:hypothetical protein
MSVAALSNALIDGDPTEPGAEGPLLRVKGIQGFMDLDENLL